MPSKKTRYTPVDPEYLLKQKIASKRSHRVVVRFNDMELAAIREYCSRRKITVLSPMLRQAIMERILTELGEDHPTLF